MSGRFAQHERYRVLECGVDRLIAVRLSDLRAHRTQEADSLVLTAATGSGKTTAMRRLIKRANAQLRASDCSGGRIVSVIVPSPATLKSLGISILAALGLQLKTDSQIWYIWDLVRFHLAENKVLFLHLDEAQDLKKKGRQNELHEIVNTLKSISQDTDWLVGFLLSGTEDLKEIVNFDRQLVRRMKAVSFDALTARSDALDMLSLVDSYASCAGLVFDHLIGSADLGKRILHASSYQFGLVIKLTIFSIEEALYAQNPSLETEHFATAFKDWKSCTEAFNPFLVNDYLKIDTSRIFTDEGDV
ncbi:ATP-binding protein [Tateyamaria sp. SN6-1]|uniref:ATP-binding protein n=1 Tax=Tateyamaria sp. SN6-1 TaxID=3092148 RepID=UPI0039F5E2C1